MSGNLAPSKSTVYISNLPFAMTNNDLFKYLEDYGKIVKVTIVKDRNHRSKGVAFVLFLSVADAKNCAANLNNTEVGGRIVKSSIAKDNGRTTEFIRRKDYPDKSLCFECGQEGHLSYQCEKNTLGPRTPPPKKVRVRNKNKDKCEADTSYYDSDSEDGLRRPQEPSNRCSSDSDEADTLSSAIKTEQKRHELETNKHRLANGQDNTVQQPVKKIKRFKKSTYFSDEEEISD